MADAKKKQLVYNIIEFLRTSSADGTIKEDDKESLEVAVQCIAESFGVDPDSASDKSQYSIAPASLLSIMDVFVKTKAKSSASGSASASGSSSAAPTEATAGASTGPSAGDKKRAEDLKAKGNTLMGQKLYDSAIEQYTAAIAIDANPVYFSNRAAAWSGLGEHEKAVEDATRAIELDPKFAKGFSRLGHAQFSLGAYQEAVTAYEQGLKLDPTNANMKSALATAKVRYAEESSSATSDREAGANAAATGAGAGGMPDLSSLASMLGGGGGGAGRGGGGGGMPDLASLMNNPQMMAMAQQMMQNGGLERMMQNPQIRQMADRFNSGGGMPDFSELANDPAMRDMAQQFMGNGAGRGGQ